MDRRAFLKAGVLAAAGLASERGQGANGPDGRGTGRVKFCVFADHHYRPGAFPNSTQEWLDRILEHAAAEQCDFIIHCGDFCHNPMKERAFVDHYNDFRIPTYHVIGNHDDDQGTHADTLKAYRLDRGYYHFDRNGFRFIVLDTSYERWTDGHFTHKEMHADGEKRPSWGWISDEELVWFRKTVMASPHPCVLFSHKSFERGVGVRAVLDVIAEANHKTPGAVRMAINGHYHVDHLRLLDNVVYFDVNSSSYMWIGSKNAHSLYPDEYIARQRIGKRCHVLAYNDPLHAIVTLGLDGFVRIEGMKSSFACGVTPKKVKAELDCHSRLITSSIGSACFRMSYG